MKSPGTLIVWSNHVANHTGMFKSSENSLNQHIKLKHPELWEKLKTVDFSIQTPGFEGSKNFIASTNSFENEENSRDNHCEKSNELRL